MMKNTTHRIFRFIGSRMRLGLPAMILFSLSLAGCGAKSEAGEPENGTAPVTVGTDTYLAEAYNLPQEHLAYVAVYQNTLYYINQESAGEDTGRSIVYRRDMAAEVDAAAVLTTLEEGLIVVGMKADGTGKLHLLTTRFGESDAPSELTWLKGDENGNFTQSVSLSSFDQESAGQYPGAFEVDDAGNIYLAAGTAVYVLDAAGNSLFKAACGSTVTHLSKDTAGKIYAIYTTDRTQMAEIDPGSQGLGVRYAPAVAEMILGVGTGTEGKMLLISAGGVYEYEMESHTTTEKFKWAALDVIPEATGWFYPLADGRLLMIDRKVQDDIINSALTVVRIQAEGEIAPEPKEILTIGGLSNLFDAPLRAAIVNFNKTNPDYRIEIKEYPSYNDFEVGLERLNTDIITGHAPDLMILLPSDSPMSDYADKGVLEDLNPYLESDQTVNRNDLQENILAAFELEGKLYGMPLSYSIQTMVGRTSVVGEEVGGTLAELNGLVDRIGDEKQVFDGYDKATILRICMTANSHDLINRDNPERGFDRETVIKILEFANRFAPEDPAADDPLLKYDRLKNGEAHLSEIGFGDILTYRITPGLFFGEPVTLMGYPSESGNGTLVNSANVIAVNSQSPNKEVAWQFISSMLSADFQENNTFTNGFSIRKSGLEKQLEQSMEATYIYDENGNNKQEVPVFSYPSGSELVHLYAATEQEVQALREVIDSVTTAYKADMLKTIISEEAPAYFSGSRSVEEVTDIVQNRIQLYWEERS